MQLTESGRAKLQELRGAGASAVVVDRVTALLSAGSDLDCYKINAFRLAAELSVPRPLVVQALLPSRRISQSARSFRAHSRPPSRA